MNSEPQRKPDDRWLPRRRKYTYRRDTTGMTMVDSCWWEWRGHQFGLNKTERQASVPPDRTPEGGPTA